MYRACLKCDKIFQPKFLSQTKCMKCMEKEHKEFDKKISDDFKNESCKKS